MTTQEAKKYTLNFTLILLISLFGVFIVGASQANAQWVWEKEFWAGMVGDALIAIQGMIGYLVALVAILCQGLLTFTEMNKSSVVMVGWEFFRDLVNILFVFILLIIAFAVILRRETYGIKALLPKLIMVALFINFSLVIAGFFIDLAGEMTKFFVKDGSKFFEDIPATMALPRTVSTNAETGQIQVQRWKCSLPPNTLFKTEKACKDHCKTASSAAGTTEGDCTFITITEEKPAVDWNKVGAANMLWNVIIALALSIVFTVIALFVFCALAFMLLARIVIIWFLLMIVPVAWLAWILPNTQSHFSKWWNTFLKWVFFAPLSTLFISLSIVAWKSFVEDKAVSLHGPIVEGMSDLEKTKAMESTILPDILHPEYFVQFLIACGMLIGSLIVAQKLSIIGADRAIAIGKSMGIKAAKWTGGAAAWLPKRGYEKMTPRLSRMAESIGQSKLARVPGVRRGLKPLQAYGEKQRKIVTEAKENLKSLAIPNLIARYKTLKPHEKVAAAQILAEKGALKPDKKGIISDTEIRKAAVRASKYGQTGDILLARPDLAPTVNTDKSITSAEAIKKTIEKIKPADVHKLQVEALSVPQVSLEIKRQLQAGGKWTRQHLQKLSESNSEAFAQIKTNIIQRNGPSAFRPDIEKYLTSTPGNTIYS